MREQRVVPGVFDLPCQLVQYAGLTLHLLSERHTVLSIRRKSIDVHVGHGDDLFDEESFFARHLFCEGIKMSRSSPPRREGFGYPSHYAAQPACAFPLPAEEKCYCSPAPFNSTDGKRYQYLVHAYGNSVPCAKYRPAAGY